MKKKGIKLQPGYRLTAAGKLEKIPGFGLDTSAKIRQRKSKKVRVAKGATTR